MATNRYKKITKDELLQKIKNHYKENNTPPSSKDMKNPSVIVYYDRFGTKKWNDILELAEVPINHKVGYTEQYLIDRLKAYVNEIGKIPTREDFRKHGVFPSHDVYRQHFGSYEKALDIAGIKKYVSSEQKTSNSLNIIIELGENLGRFPTVAEYDAEFKKKEGMNRRSLERNLRSKYNDICRKTIPTLKANLVHNEYAGGDIIADIKQCLDFYSPVVPVYNEYVSWSDKGYSYKTIKKFCGMSYMEIVKFLGYKSRGTTTKTKSREEMIHDFVVLYKEIGRIPTHSDINKCNFCCSAPTYTAKFGTIENICVACDIEYVANQDNGFGYIVKDKNGEYCKSLGEANITNYFIDHGIKYEKEFSYNKIPGFSKKDKRKLDWVIKNKNHIYYIEYFGCYTNTKNKSINKSYVIKADKKVSDFSLLDMLDRCIFIYPKDYNTKTLGEIFLPYFERDN